LDIGYWVLLGIGVIGRGGSREEAMIEIEAILAKITLVVLPFAGLLAIVLIIVKQAARNKRHLERGKAMEQNRDQGMIYLIGVSGAACTPNEGMAKALEEVAGYQRCTEDEYWERLREIEAVDGPAEEVEQGGKESNVKCEGC
jgi:hypothetical protein